jgi:hypothetical protein
MEHREHLRFLNQTLKNPLTLYFIKNESLRYTTLAFRTAVSYFVVCGILVCVLLVKGKVHPCTGTEALYRPYGP